MVVSDYVKGVRGFYEAIACSSSVFNECMRVFGELGIGEVNFMINALMRGVYNPRVWVSVPVLFVRKPVAQLRPLTGNFFLTVAVPGVGAEMIFRWVFRKLFSASR